MERLTHKIILFVGVGPGCCDPDLTESRMLTLGPCVMEIAPLILIKTWFNLILKLKFYGLLNQWV